MLSINYKKIFLSLIVFSIIAMLFGCQNTDNNSIEYIKKYIKNKGKNNITWTDFDYLEHEDIGSGIRIEKYQLINGELLLIGIEKPEKIIIIQDGKEEIIKNWD